MAMALASAGREQEQFSNEGAQEHLQELFLQPAGPGNVLLADTVAGAFFSTNVHRGEHYTLEELLDCARTASWGRARHFKFTHCGVSYLATVDVWEGPDRAWLVLKLPNDGFQYTRKAGQQRHRHKCGGWVNVEMPAVLEFFPALFGAVERHFEEAVFYYNFDHQRMDVQFLPKDARGLALAVTFEPGYPYTDDTVQFAPLGRV